MLETKGKEDIIIKKKISLLPNELKGEVLDFIEFLLRRSKKNEPTSLTRKAVAAVENSWGTIRLNREDLIFVAENTSIEYETR